MIFFLHIPKSGGTTFRSILEKNFGVSNCHTNQTKRPVFTERDLHLAERFFPKLRSVSGHNLIDLARFAGPDAFVMTILRDPIQRVVSHYQDSVLRGGNQRGFEETIRISQNLQNLQVKLLAGGSNLEKAKRFLAQECQMVGFTEKFDLSLHLFERISPVGLNLSYTRKVVARNNDVKKAILSDDRLVDMAREFNKLDLDLHSFAIDEIFPSLCEKAGIDPAAPVPKYETASTNGAIRQKAGRLYNRMFRQFYKVYSRFSPDDSLTDEFAWFQPTHIARE